MVWIPQNTSDTACPFRTITEMAKEFDSMGFVGAILMNLSKTYGYLPYDLLIVKLKAYLSFSKKRTNIGFAYSKW